LWADDYLVKPFVMRELLARLRALLWRVALQKRET
jgi:DNA-binding response OmpR family regulator